MVTAPALVKGDARHLLAFDPSEHPVACQLGGSDPKELAIAARMVAEEGYAEVNLNVGCPSDRVQSGCFGAVLMKEPGLVAACLDAMRAAVDIPVTIKCRIGVDDQEPTDTLPMFLEHIQAAGVERVIIHARKAWLQGLSTKENRDIPPLDYALVHRMQVAFPALKMSLNGGLTSLAEAQAEIKRGVHGAMIGRAAYHRPADILMTADTAILGADHNPCRDALDAVEAMRPIIADHLATGGRLHSVTRHMLGLFSGRPGARHWRRTLSAGATRPGAGLELIDAALADIAGKDERHLRQHA